MMFAIVYMIPEAMTRIGPRQWTSVIGITFARPTLNWVALTMGPIVAMVTCMAPVIATARKAW